MQWVIQAGTVPCGLFMERGKSCAREWVAFAAFDGRPVRNMATAMRLRLQLVLN